MTPPSPSGVQWAKTPIDLFILQAMEREGLTSAQPARFEELIRRTALALTGLQPSPDEVEFLVQRASAETYSQWVDQLLASPHYGERWGRHWLDLARYAESDGFEHDAIRPHSWRYRDYVIRAFNQDKPFDRFIQEQVAGDELWPDSPEALIATGFNLLGPDMVDSADQVQRRLNTLNDMSDTVASVFLGQTLGCARCHDHKSEPFTQIDYYSWQAYFAPADFDRESPVLRTTNGPPPRTWVLRRGDYAAPQQEVSPAIPVVLQGSAPNGASVDVPAKGRRALLARWISSPTNPLTARVMVNRVWQHHFGVGIVRSPSDFGTRGSTPSHPELLDWLSHEFVEKGWSIKQLHRLILRSAVYQQSTQPSPHSRARDAENRWFSRQNPQRLEGEVLRDNLLLASDGLYTSMGGPSVLPPIPEDLIKTSRNWNVSPNPADHSRRSIYILARRNLRFPFLETFDAPDSNLSCPERGRSTTAPQSLTLLNSWETMAASQRTAQRLTRAGERRDEFVHRAYRTILGRAPKPEELQLAEAFLAESSPAEFCRALFNLNEFVYAP